MKNNYLRSYLKRTALFLFMKEMHKCWLLKYIIYNFSRSHIYEIFDHELSRQTQESYEFLRSTLQILVYIEKNV